ncbi:ribokinase-like isoform X3 [Mangifera indica]|uniref:ribokinase-like isoform X3 n=1 Tax=Mangifera indica TaxID=29780 RepID=UPI001CFAF259|nr:ribokinase-like isoform X3 [Mangifera indica]
MTMRFQMSSDSIPPLPESQIVVGCGAVALDFLAVVAAYPKPDDKIRSIDFKVAGGGNAGNALTCAARLGLSPRIISKIANDPQGKGILKELEADNVDTSFLVVSEEGNSTFCYVIIDDQAKTRTGILTPGYPPFMPSELPLSTLLSALDGARIAYFDGRLPETAIVIAQEAARKNIPILVDVEMEGEGFADLLKLADYAVCSENFPQAWTEVPSMPGALVALLLRLPNLKFVIVTLGENGCIMLQRSVDENLDLEEIDVDSLLETLEQRKDKSVASPTSVSSLETKLRANGIGTVCGRLFVGTAEKIPPSELTDTTGAGDAFIGAVLYAICTNMPPEKMLPFAAQVAAANCRALGARGGLPHRTDPRLASFLQ